MSNSLTSEKVKDKLIVLGFVKNEAAKHKWFVLAYTWLYVLGVFSYGLGLVLCVSVCIDWHWQVQLLSIWFLICGIMCLCDAENIRFDERVRMKMLGLTSEELTNTLEGHVDDSV